MLIEKNFAFFILLATIATSGCERTPERAPEERRENMHSETTTLKCDMKNNSKRTGVTSESQDISAYYRINSAKESVSIWSDTSSKFENVCSGMKCKISISSDKFQWKVESDNNGKKPPLMILVDYMTISRSTGEISGNRQYAVIDGTRTLDNGSARYSGKCETSNFTGRSRKF